MTHCPCGSNRTFNECCGPYLSGERPAPTVEALMRARYSAFTTQQIDYLEETLLPETRGDFERDHVAQWAETSQWTGLDVLGVTGGGEHDNEGTVEFAAHFTVSGKAYRHHEVSRFVKREDRWWYLDGDIVLPKPRTVVKIGRNDPCSCGSGKKYKKCCCAAS